VVFAPTNNGAGVLAVRVTRRAAESTLARIIELVAQAQSTRAPTQRLIDRFGNRYAWLVIVSALLTMSVPVVALDWTFEAAFYRAMTLLVVASPCALVISTPASYLSAIANAARHGVLFKGGAYLEAAAAVDVVALDKTGTLTYGRPEVTDVVPWNGCPAEDLLALAGAVERHSEHLLARAVVDAARARGVPLDAASGVRALPGLGIHGWVGDREVRIGSPRMFRDGDGLPSHAAEAVAALERQGKTVMVVGAGDPLGALAVADRVRPSARETIAALRRAGVRRVVMVTGDNERVAHAVAAEVGIAAEDVFASLLPAEKVHVVENLRTGGRVAFVGDGVNDAPALAASNIGIAMGAGGTDVALETADVVLMGDHLELLGHVFGLGRAARRVVQQNVAFSAGVIAVLVLATLVRGIPLPLGVVGHEGSTVVVVLNGLRLLGFQGPVRRRDEGLYAGSPSSLAGGTPSGSDAVASGGR
jgi:Cd2+/Zn2+-exporting ATPase